MAQVLQDKGRKFKRIRQSAKEKIQLGRAGFQHVLSSNVSAIAQNGNNLVVRFHGGATYEYRGVGDLYDEMLKSSSKGKFVWNKLIRPRVPFGKVGSVKLQSDAQFTDRDLVTQTAGRKPKKVSLLQQLGLSISRQDLITKGIIATKLSGIASKILVTTP